MSDKGIQQKLFYGEPITKKIVVKYHPSDIIEICLANYRGVVPSEPVVRSYTTRLKEYRQRFDPCPNVPLNVWMYYVLASNFFAWHADLNTI